MSKKIDETRDHTLPELNEKLADAKTEISKEKSLAVSGTKSEKPSKIRNLRRNIARILTIMNEKKHGIIIKKTKKGEKQ